MIFTDRTKSHMDFVSSIKAAEEKFAEECDSPSSDSTDGVKSIKMTTIPTRGKPLAVLPENCQISQSRKPREEQNDRSIQHLTLNDLLRKMMIPCTWSLNQYHYQIFTKYEPWLWMPNKKYDVINEQPLIIYVWHFISLYILNIFWMWTSNVWTNKTFIDTWPWQFAFAAQCTVACIMSLCKGWVQYLWIR